MKKQCRPAAPLALSAAVFMVTSAAGLAATATLSFPDAAAPAGCAPLKGLVLWPDNAEDRPDLSGATSLEFSYCLPCDVAVGTNADGSVRYDWGRIDSLLESIASRKHQAILRFRYAYPGEKLGGVKGATAVPKFVKERPDYKETYAANPGGDGPTYYPDWSCKALEDFTLEFYRAFAARYDEDPRLAFLQVGFGHWAEYHTYGTALKPGANFPTLDFQRRFFRQMSEAMRLTPWMVSIDSAARDDGYSPVVALNGEGVRFGLFDDSFMCREHEISSGDGDNERNWNAFGTSHYEHSPHGGEISYYRDSDQKKFLGPAGIYGVTWAQAAAKYHMTFVIANDAPEGSYATKAHFLQAQAECGYKLEVASAEETGDGLRVVVRNAGVAPFYFPATLACNGSRAAGSLKGLQPSKTMEFFVPGARSGATLEIVSPKFLGGAIEQEPDPPVQEPEPELKPEPEPEPTPEPAVVRELYKAVEGVTPTGAASEYWGYFADAQGNLKGTIQVKVGKVGKTGEAAITAMIVIGAKKLKLKPAGKGKAVINADGTTTISLVGPGAEACEITLGAVAMGSKYGGWAIDGARNVLASKDKAEQGAANAVLRNWQGPVNVVWDGGNANVTIAAKGKAKVTVTLANGKKITANGQLIIGETWCCVPVAAPKAGVAFLLWLPRAADATERVPPDADATSASIPAVVGLGDGVIVGKPGTLAAGAAFRIDAADAASAWGQSLGAAFAELLPDGIAVKQSGARWALPKAGKAAYQKGTTTIDPAKAGENPSGLKLTYKANDGSFKGSFNVYADVGGKLKSTKAQVAGVMVNGVGYGKATIKGKWGVAIEVK